MDLVISSNGFGIDTINSGNIPLENATIQFGEPFHSTMISAGNDKQSMWFKFTLPTTRAVRVTLGQPGTAINEADVGFSVYKTNTCLPTLSDLGPAKLTTVNKFGNTFNECLTPGDYLIQVGSKTGVDSAIFIELTTGYPFESVSFDYGGTAYDYGTLTSGYKPSSSGVMMDLGCYSVDSIAEMACTELGGNYQEYGQTIYQTFTTDNFIDALRFEIRSLQSGVGNVGIKIFDGDVRVSDISTLSQIGACHVVNTTSAWNGFNELCILNPNSTYTLQISVHKDVDAKNILTRLDHRGIGVTQGSNPANLPPNNLLGVLPSSPGGTITIGTDVFSCNAFIDSALCGVCNIADTNICSTNNPSGGVTIGGNLYELATWYTFTLTGDADVVIASQNYTYKRIFSGDVTGDCNLPV